MPAKPRRTQAERAESTRDALLRAGRELFGVKGFAGVSGEQVVSAAGVTRGALYHHFDGKDGLFEAVFERISSQIAADLEATMAEHEDPQVAMTAAVSRFFDHAGDPEVQRVTLLDAPTVLGWSSWREREVERSLRLFGARLTDVLKGRDDAEVVGQLFFAAAVEGALIIAHADDPGPTRARVEGALLTMVAGTSAAYGATSG